MAKNRTLSAKYPSICCRFELKTRGSFWLNQLSDCCTLEIYFHVTALESFKKSIFLKCLALSIYRLVSLLLFVFICFTKASLTMET